MSCGVGGRCGANPVLLWLWCKPAATALISTPSLGTSICVGVALKRQKKKKRKERVVELRTFGVITSIADNEK